MASFIRAGHRVVGFGFLPEDRNVAEPSAVDDNHLGTSWPPHINQRPFKEISEALLASEDDIGRGRGEGVLEGCMHRTGARAVLMTYEDMKEKGLLDKLVDDDANPETLPVPRHELLRDLLYNSLSYLRKKHGHAPNQEMMNVRAPAPLHQALELLGGYEELDVSKLQKQMRERIAQITGLKPFGSPHSQQEYWVSPKASQWRLAACPLPITVYLMTGS